jgi:hypothetical protein
MSVRKQVLVAVAAFAALLVLAWVLGLFGRVANPDRVVASYEAFFNRCASVQTLETQRDQLEAQLAETDPDDTSEVSRLRSALPLDVQPLEVQTDDR